MKIVKYSISLFVNAWRFNSIIQYILPLNINNCELVESEFSPYPPPCLLFFNIWKLKEKSIFKKFSIKFEHNLKHDNIAV